MTAPFRGEGLATLEGVAEVVYDPWIDHTPLRLMNEEALAARIAEEGADIVVCEADACTGAVLDAGLRVIGSTRGDPTNVDVPGATERGIPVLHAPGRNADGVAELAVGLLLAATRGIVPADRDVRTGTVYDGRHHPLPALPGLADRRADGGHHRPGLGRAGRGVALRGPGHAGHQPTTRSTTPPPTTSTTCWPRPTWCRCTPWSRPRASACMGTDQFARMKPGAVYLNTARAALHDIDALTAALASGHLGAAGLDHFEGENLPTDHPLQAMTNVVLTPHIGGRHLRHRGQPLQAGGRRHRPPAGRRAPRPLRQPGGAAMSDEVDRRAEQACPAMSRQAKSRPR